MTVIFVGDVGTKIILDCGVDISSATVRKIRARRPGGSVVIWNANPLDTNAIAYTIAAGDIDVAGNWQFQAYVEMPGWSGFGSIADVKVEKPF